MWLVSHRAAACHRTRLFRASHGLAGSNRVVVGTGRFELPTPRTPSECSSLTNKTKGFARHFRILST
jgi:hypothetical protein